MKMYSNGSNLSAQQPNYISKYGGDQHNAKSLAQRAKENPFYKQNSNIKSYLWQSWNCQFSLKLQ